ARGVGQGLPVAAPAVAVVRAGGLPGWADPEVVAPRGRGPGSAARPVRRHHRSEHEITRQARTTDHSLPLAVGFGFFSRISMLAPNLMLKLSPRSSHESI